MYYIIIIAISLFSFSACHSGNLQANENSPAIILGAEQTRQYLPLLHEKNVALLVNQTSRLSSKHLVDTLLDHNISIKKIFSPEHGFRGESDAGETVKDSRDVKTGIPIVSLYGSNKKPSAQELSDIDVVIFDVQDVGVRFYTYISSMHYMMEACAENNKKMIILDRPNPNGMYVDGPVLEKEFRSFVGIHPIPVLHGLTVGELALMINGEKWLNNGVQCDLEVITMKNYNHSVDYSLPVKPSPNLPNDQSIKLYPSLCLFEGTTMSIGRGTYFPFQVIGYPDPAMGEFTFRPESIEGMAKNPKHEGKTCYGVDLRTKSFSGGLSLQYLLHFYEKYNNKDSFFNNYFNTLVGNKELMQQIKAGLDEESIRLTWVNDLNDYRNLRKKYILYPDN